MPRRAIELLDPASLLFTDASFLGDLKSVLAQPGFKIFTAYREPWWEKTSMVRIGRSITDLPIRQCYYWGTEEAQEGGEPGNRNSILMASYNDGPTVEFWAGLSRTDKFRPLYQPGEGPSSDSAPPPREVPEELRAPVGMVREMHRQLVELHGLDPREVPQPYETVYRDWTQDPFGGGWHFWKIHVKSSEIIPRILHPLPGVNLYICGEAWSSWQGWVEGALETVDLLLHDHFGMDDPAWYSAGPVGSIRAAGAPVDDVRGGYR